MVSFNVAVALLLIMTAWYSLIVYSELCYTVVMEVLSSLCLSNSIMVFPWAEDICRDLSAHSFTRSTSVMSLSFVVLPEPIVFF